MTSPTLANQIKEMLAAFPAAKWHQWEPAGAHSRVAGARLAFGQPVNTIYDLSGADVIVSLDADFLSVGTGQPAIRAAVFRAAAGARRADRDEPPLRGRADAHSHGHQGRSPVAAAGRRCGTVRLEPGGGTGRGYGRAEGRIHSPADKWIVPIARDLQKHKGASLVIAGEQQSAAVHALAHAMNAALGNVGKTVSYTDPVEANPVDQVASLYDLVKDLDAGAVDLLLILGGNPAYNAPVELGFRDRLKKAALRVHLSLHEDETSELCHWHLPMTHYLETWSDCRAHDGTATIMQPLIAPLYAGKSAHEVLTMLTGELGTDLVPDRERLLGHAAYRPGFRSLVAQGGARWRGAGYGAARLGTSRCARDGPQSLTASRPIRKGWKWFSVPIPRCMTAASPTTAGCRSGPARSPS